MIILREIAYALRLVRRNKGFALAVLTAQIVGIARVSKTRDIGDSPQPFLYLPVEQSRQTRCVRPTCRRAARRASIRWPRCARNDERPRCSAFDALPILNVAPSFRAARRPWAGLNAWATTGGKAGSE
jgi:hypothetical protein